MNTILKNILAVVLGVIIGGLINMGIIMISSHIIPVPEGIDVMNEESLKAGIHLFEPKHFIFPFLAHAGGAFSGAFIAAFIAKEMRIAYIVAFISLLGGIGAVMMIPAPLWYNVLDLVLAYLPMGYLGGKLALKLSGQQNN